ncbi:50S ribosomal protein L24 [Patescibacteria group bacterium]|nr:50S ribosomal protein L24 [Patescibacteria group bacterium]
MFIKLKIKKNDIVKVLAGRDKGKQGKVTQVFPEESLVVVEGVNLRFKHLKASGKGQGGSKVQFAAPLKANKLMVVCPHCSKGTRITLSTTTDGKKVRLCHRCKQSLVTI